MSVPEFFKVRADAWGQYLGLCNWNDPSRWLWPKAETARKGGVMTVVELLKKTRERIAAPANWTQGTLARDAAGNPCSCNSEGATCWCLGGALCRTSCGGVPLPSGVYGLAQRALERQCQCYSEFNDTHTHEEVLALLDRAIAEQEKEEAA